MLDAGTGVELFVVEPTADRVYGLGAWAIFMLEIESRWLDSPRPSRYGHHFCEPDWRLHAEEPHMLDMITKSDLFYWADQKIDFPRRNNLKDFQDAFILSLLSGREGLRILEMGGGDSRVLRQLAPKNECWNLEIFEGKDNGPARVVNIPGVKNVYGLMGQYLSELPDNYFDWVFSVSVMEHVPFENIPDVYLDAARVLKPGGFMAHAIDMYMLDDTRADHPINEENRERLTAYQNLPEAFSFVDAPALDQSLRFRTSYVTNPHLAMLTWNIIAPSLKPLREIADAVSLKMLLQKNGEAASPQGAE